MYYIYDLYIYIYDVHIYVCIIYLLKKLSMCYERIYFKKDKISFLHFSSFVSVK